MIVNKIYFDMDSVLADFVRGVREICGVEHFSCIVVSEHFSESCLDCGV